MDGLTFVSTVLRVAAWPVTVVVLAVLFRGRFDDLLTRLESAQTRAGTLKFAARTFVEALATVEGFAEAALPTAAADD